MKLLLPVIIACAAVNLSSAQGAQPHMQIALSHLRAARSELQRAEHNKGGWRVRALANVDRAISDTESGIKAGR